MQAFEPLVGAWRGAGEIATDPPTPVAVDATVERLGAFIVLRSVGRTGGVPDSISVIGGAPDGEPQPMRYTDERGVERRFLTTLDDGTWTIWLAPGQDWNGPNGPGFNQRFIGTLSADGATIDGRWERGLGDAGDRWELDFPLTYVRAAAVADDAVDLFAGMPVSDDAAAVAWYERLFGAPAFLPDDTEAVWEVGEHRYLYVDVRPEHAGHAMQTLFVGDLDGFVDRAAARGIEPASRETYDNGVRKVIFRDPDGNELGVGGGA